LNVRDVGNTTQEVKQNESAGNICIACRSDAGRRSSQQIASIATETIAKYVRAGRRKISEGAFRNVEKMGIWQNGIWRRNALIL
jgi:hypothetical protein